LEENFILSGVLLGTGFILFAIDFRMVMFLGVPLGIILAQQFKTQQYIFKFKSIGDRAFLYSIILAIVIVNLFPRELYFTFKWSFAITLLAIAVLQIFLLYKFESSFELKDSFQGKYEKSAKIPQFISIILAYLFLLLFNLTITQEKFYYHLIWGLESFPTKLALQFSIASALLLALFLFEVLRIKDVDLEKKYKYLIFLVGLSCYIFIPFLLQGIIVFFLIHVVLIFGSILLIDNILSNFPHYIDETSPSTSNDERQEKESVRGFTFLVFGFFLWFMFIFVLIVTPPVTIVVDTYNLLEKAGILGITDIVWPPFVWTLFYIPSIYLFLALPITIFCLLYGIIFTFTTPAA
jgi:hypothetical protein